MRCLRALSVALFLSPALFGSAAAEDAESQISEPLRIAPEEDQWLVRGIAANDLLNVREKPSPLGKTLGRLPNGSLVRLETCEDVEGYEWCRITALDADDLSGWTPARYLQSLAEFSAEMERQAAAPAEDDGGADEPVPSEMVRAADGTPMPQPAPREEAAVAADPVTVAEAPAEEPASTAPDQAETAAPDDDAPTETAVSEADVDETEVVQDGRGSRLAGQEPELPPGLEARFAGAEPAPLAGASSAETEQAEPEPAGEPSAPAVAAERPQDEDADGSGAADETADAGEAAPEPPSGETEQVALAGETGAAARPPMGEVAGEVPCARHVGQPMTRCLLMVARSGDGEADVTVVWPDGGRRLIEFRGGVPARSDAADEFRYTREGTLNMIRIGRAERFEILDALAFGG